MRYRTEKSGPCLQKQNDKKDWLARITELHAFLQGQLPEGVTAKAPKLSPEKAMTVVWFLQELTECLPDNFEMCCDCKEIFDSYAEGGYVEKTGRHYCESCLPSEGTED